MSRHLNVLIPDGLLATIDAAATERNWNRSEFVRWAMSHALLRDEPFAYAPPTLPNWQTEAWTALLRGLFGVEHLMLSTDVKTMLRQAVEALDERSARVLRLRFGLDGPQYTLKEVGAIMGTTRERVRQVEAQALRRMRGLLRRSGIWELLREQLDKEESDD